MVRARSDAEIPVVTPSRASIDTVKFVPYCVPFSPAPTIIGKPSSSQRASVKHKHTKPRACVTIKLIAAGVTKSLASTKSPSFSRSSSSTSTTIRPALSSAIISSVLAILAGCVFSGILGSINSILSTSDIPFLSNSKTPLYAICTHTI